MTENNSNEMKSCCGLPEGTTLSCCSPEAMSKCCKGMLACVLVGGAVIAAIVVAIILLLG